MCGEVGRSHVDLGYLDALVDRASEVPHAHWNRAVLADLPAADEPPPPPGRAEHDGDVVACAAVHVDEVCASEATDTLPPSGEVAGGQRRPAVGALERGAQRLASARRMGSGRDLTDPRDGSRRDPEALSALDHGSHRADRFGCEQQTRDRDACKRAYVGLGVAAEKFSVHGPRPRDASR